MSEQSRAEYRLRQICRVDGIVELTDGEMDAYLALLFPGLDGTEARSAHVARRDSMRMHDRFMERVRRSDFAKEFRRVAAMTPEQHEEMRRRAVDALDEPRAHWKWDPYKSAGENMFNLRKWQAHGGWVQ